MSTTTHFGITKNSAPNELAASVAAALDTLDSLLFSRTVGGAQFVAVPSTATSAGSPNQMAYDGTHLYVCIATNSWVRAAVAAW